MHIADNVKTSNYKALTKSLKVLNEIKLTGLEENIVYRKELFTKEIEKQNQFLADLNELAVRINYLVSNDKGSELNRFKLTQLAYLFSKEDEAFYTVMNDIKKEYTNFTPIPKNELAKINKFIGERTTLVNGVMVVSLMVSILLISYWFSEEASKLLKSMLALSSVTFIAFIFHKFEFDKNYILTCWCTALISFLIIIWK